MSCIYIISINKCILSVVLHGTMMYYSIQYTLASASTCIDEGQSEQTTCQTKSLDKRRRKEKTTDKIKRQKVCLSCFFSLSFLNLLLSHFGFFFLSVSWPLCASQSFISFVCIFVRKWRMNCTPVMVSINTRHLY
jgi:hypothetical protein